MRIFKDDEEDETPSSEESNGPAYDGGDDETEEFM